MPITILERDRGGDLHHHPGVLRAGLVRVIKTGAMPPMWPMLREPTARSQP